MQRRTGPVWIRSFSSGRTPLQAATDNQTCHGIWKAKCARVKQIPRDCGNLCVMASKEAPGDTVETEHEESQTHLLNPVLPKCIPHLEEEIN